MLTKDTILLRLASKPTNIAEYRRRWYAANVAVSVRTGRRAAPWGKNAYRVYYRRLRRAQHLLSTKGLKAAKTYWSNTLTGG